MQAAASAESGERDGELKGAAAPYAAICLWQIRVYPLCGDTPQRPVGNGQPTNGTPWASPTTMGRLPSAPTPWCSETSFAFGQELSPRVTALGKGGLCASALTHKQCASIAGGPGEPVPPEKRKNANAYLGARPDSVRRSPYSRKRIGRATAGLFLFAFPCVKAYNSAAVGIAGTGTGV